MYLHWLSACLLSLWVSISWADEGAFHKDDDFNAGEYGIYPTHKFKTSTIEPPRINFMKEFSNCDDGSYIFVTPRGNVAYSSFYILDHEGSLIWGPDHKYGEVYNFQMQYYQGEPYLFLWAGDDSVGGHGEGKYYMLDQHYEEHSKISAGDGIRGDLHAFQITDEQTAIFTGYQVVQADLTSVGKDNTSWIWESLFQELDIETGQVLFEWRASEHFPFTDAFVTPNKATHGQPWDFFHINMVDKDPAGNYLVSTRYGRCALYISKDTGEILWQLGGKSNSFKDMSGGDATEFLGQHDVHWSKPDFKAITMFDNRADWFNKIEDESAGHRIAVDLERMEATLIQSYRHPNHILSTSQGSMQTLPNGNVLVGYGFNGAFTEYSPDGKALCDAYMEPSKRFGSGDVQSYRDLKYNWTGIPLTTPDIVYEEETLYMSWLGSTKVKTWLLQDCETADGNFRSVQSTPKRGFETEFMLKTHKRMQRYVRVIAVDNGGTQLSISHPVDLLEPNDIWGPLKPGEEVEHMSPGAAAGNSLDDGHANDDHDGGGSMNEDMEDVQILLILGVLAAVSAALVAWMTFGTRWTPWRRKASGEKGYQGAFRDDGRGRRLWQWMRSKMPGGRRSWRSSTARHQLLPSDEREDSAEFSIDE